MRASKAFTRRELLGVVGLAGAGCSTATSEYFGRVTCPPSQRLVQIIGAEPATLDPHLSADLYESYVIQALFEGLTDYHPETAEPVAAVATHYEVTADHLRYKFYLRGHASPAGTRLPEAPATVVAPALWTDGNAVTSRDFVYSWRRVVDPATAAPMSYLFACVAGAPEVVVGAKPPSTLGVRALDDFTLQVDLNTPAPYFLQLTSMRTAFAIPGNAFARFEGPGSRWTDPSRIVSNGPFRLVERRPQEYVRVARNTLYHSADDVRLLQIEFAVVPEAATSLTLYRSGEVDLIQTEMLPVAVPTLRKRRDFSIHANFAAVYPMFNVRTAPMNNVAVRYAFNMATDKRKLCDSLGAGQTPARTLVPESSEYSGPDELHANIGGIRVDVLQHDARAARALLGHAGFPDGIGSDGRKLSVELLYPQLPDSEPIALVLQHQWQRTLNIEVKLVAAELQAWISMCYGGDYRHICLWGDFGRFVDPYWFIGQFVTGSGANGTGWNDPAYDGMVAEAEASLGAARMKRMADCERRLLSAMPMFPLFFSTWTVLQKPYVRGIGYSVLSPLSLKRAWIDQTWRCV